MRVCTGFHHSRKSRPISNQATEQTVLVIFPIKERRDFLHGRSPHFITLIISSFTSSVGFPAERSLLRKARSAPRNSRASSGDSSTIRFSALRRNICSTSIVSADTHHSKCANENLLKSEYGSLLKGCRRSTNWKLDYKGLCKYTISTNCVPLS